MNENILREDEALNKMSFGQKNYFSELLLSAMEKGIITLRDGIDCKCLVDKSIHKDYKKWIRENRFDADIGQYREIHFVNHIYVLSLFLYDRFTPENALVYMLKTPVCKMREEAIRYYEKQINSIYLKLKSVEKDVKGEMSEVYNEVLQTIVGLFSFDSRAKILSEDYKLDVEYITMNSFSLDNQNIIRFFSDYVDAFIIEVGIINKLRDEIKEVVTSAYGSVANDFLLEYLCRLLELKYPDIVGDKKRLKKDKRLAMGMPTEEVFQLMFSDYGAITFSQEEKEYICRFFLK